MRRFIGLEFLATSISLVAQDQNGGWQPDLTRLQTYTSHRASSSDPTGANADARRVQPGASLTLLDTDGPGNVSHIWFTISSDEPYHLKRIVLRIYWDGEATPSVEAPIGDFFGLGLGDYYSWSLSCYRSEAKIASTAFSPCLSSGMPGLRYPMRAGSRSGVFITTSITRQTPIRWPPARCISMLSIARPSPITDGPTIGPPMAIRWSMTNGT